jgi:transposase
MEACAGAHYWAREIAKLGHHVRLIAPAYVKPFIRRQKNDAAVGKGEPLLKHQKVSGPGHKIR